MGNVFGASTDPSAGSGAISSVLRVKLNHLQEVLSKWLVNWNQDSDLCTLKSDIMLPVGMVAYFGGSTLPSGWVSPLPQIRNIVEFPRLAAYYGTLHGGDGINTFGMPKLPGRVIGGAGQGAGLTNRAIASINGEEAHQNTEAENGPHNHSFTAPLTNTTSPAGVIGIISSYNNLGSAQGGTISTSGSGSPHNNIQPTIWLLVGIKT